MNPTESTAVVEIDGQQCTLYFNWNAYSAFEKLTGVFFLDFLATVRDAVRESQKNGIDQVEAELAVLKSTEPEHERISELTSWLAEAREKASFDVLRRVSIGKMLAITWAAFHRYERKEAKWDLTIDELGSRLSMKDVLRLLPIILSAAGKSVADTESTPRDDDRPTPPPPPNKSGDGGNSFGPPDESILDSMTKI